MDKKELESLADAIVGKITMPGHAFATNKCVDFPAPFSCSLGSFIVHSGQSDPATCTPSITCNGGAGEMFDCAGVFNGAATCTAPTLFTCSGGKHN